MVTLFLITLVLLWRKIAFLPFFAGIGISSSNHGRNGKPPCVGLCYYEKLMDLQGKKAAEKEPNQTIQVGRLQTCALLLAGNKIR